MKQGVWGLLVAIFVCIGYFQDPGPAPNLPEGAIEYFETQDGKTSVTLYPDELVMEGDAIIGEDHMAIKIAEITSMKKYGNKLIIRAADGAWMEIQISSFLDGRRLKKRIDELRKG